MNLFIVKKFRRHQLNTNYNCIIRDFNIDILDENFESDSSDNHIKQKFLNDLMEDIYAMLFWNNKAYI